MLYFFHLHECGVVTRDRVGAELTNLAAAQWLAVKEARIAMCAEIKEGRLCLDCHIEIADADGRRLAIVRFRDAVSIRGDTGMAVCH